MFEDPFFLGGGEQTDASSGKPALSARGSPSATPEGCGDPPAVVGRRATSESLSCTQRLGDGRRICSKCSSVAVGPTLRVGDPVYAPRNLAGPLYIDRQSGLLDRIGSSVR